MPTLSCMHKQNMKLTTEYSNVKNAHDYKMQI